MASIRSLVASSSRLSAPRISFRALSTSPRSLLPEQSDLSSASSSSSSSVPPPTSPANDVPTSKVATFASLGRALQMENPLISPNGPSAHTPERAQAIRGYALDALPPNVDPMLDLFTNLLMKHGKKAEAQRRVANILAMIQQTANDAPLPLLHRAITLSSPYLRVMSTRRRAKIVLTPMALDERQRTRQGIQWLLKAAEKGRKGGIPREQRIAKEVFAVLEGGSDVFKWIEERHKVATANRSNIKSR